MAKHSERSAQANLLLEVLAILKAEPCYRAAIHGVRSVERRYARETADPTERMGMRLGTAKLLFYAAIEKGAAFRTVQRRFRARTFDRYVPSKERPRSPMISRSSAASFTFTGIVMPLMVQNATRYLPRNRGPAGISPPVCASWSRSMRRFSSAQISRALVTP